MACTVTGRVTIARAMAGRMAIAVHAGAVAGVVNACTVAGAMACTVAGVVTLGLGRLWCWHTEQPICETGG